MPDVVVVGDINVDILAPVDRYPAPGGHGLAEEVRLESGGSAANTAVMLGLLGLETVMLGRVGNDALAGRALRGMKRAGIDVSRVRRDASAATAIFFIAVTPDGERTMFGGRGANHRLSPDDIDRDAIETARWLHLSGYALLSASGRAALREAREIARRAGVPISFDVGIGPSTERWRGAIAEVAAHADVLLPSEQEAMSLTEEGDPVRAARRLQVGTTRLVALKRSLRGCYVVAGEESWTLPAFDIDAVDSTGAGDAFNAGIIAGRLAELPLRASALLANVLGAVATTVPGAGGAVPGPAAVRAFLAEGRCDPRWAEWREEFDMVMGMLEEEE